MIRTVLVLTALALGLAVPAQAETSANRAAIKSLDAFAVFEATCGKSFPSLEKALKLAEAKGFQPAGTDEDGRTMVASETIDLSVSVWRDQEGGLHCRVRYGSNESVSTIRQSLIAIVKAVDPHPTRGPLHYRNTNGYFGVPNSFRRTGQHAPLYFSVVVPKSQ